MKMKKRVSFTLDPKTDKDLEKFLRKTEYRNKSDLIERAIKLFLRREKDVEK